MLNKHIVKNLTLKLNLCNEVNIDTNFSFLRDIFKII